MQNESNISGDNNQNIVIQGVTDSTITLNVGGETKEIQKTLEAMQAILEQQQALFLQFAGKRLDSRSLTEENLNFFVDQARKDKSFPNKIASRLITETEDLIEGLGMGFEDEGVSVSDDPSDIIQNFGWLIEEYLRKMLTETGQEGDLRAFSYMTEAYQASLRYLCLIQIAQVLRMENKTEKQKELIRQYLLINGEVGEESLPEEHSFDYLNFFIQVSGLLKENFVPGVQEFYQKLINTKSNLFSIALFLEDQRNRLLNNKIKEEDLDSLIPQFLTALETWLAEMAFLAKYKLLSIKDINLNYKLGFTQSFVHYYGELHGMFDMNTSSKENKRIKIEKYFTFNQSVLLMEGNNVEECLNKIDDPNNILSLSPLVIDLSVFDNKNTQTPEIYFYTGYSVQDEAIRELKYHFALYRNELPLEGQTELNSNRRIGVSKKNRGQKKLNELYKQLDEVLKPFNVSAS